MVLSVSSGGTIYADLEISSIIKPVNFFA